MSTVVTDRLREALGRRPKPLIICGAGVSVHASGRVAPNWAEIIAAGIDRAYGIDPSLKAWATWARHRLEHEKAASWIEVADELTIRLGGQHNAEFLQFLEEQVGRLELRDRRLIEALLKLGCPLATTNYDDLLFHGSGLPVVNWTEAEEVSRCLSGEWQGIIHLHGHWRKPQTVVLGTQSYDKLLSDERSRLIRQMTTLTRPTVFIGCSFDGISDPDFDDLDRFIGQWQSTSQPRYILIKSGGDTTPRLDRRLYPVEYGPSYDDLAPFLERLSTDTASPATAMGTAAASTALRCIDKKVPKPDLFGRDQELADIVAAATCGRSVVIAGGPGVGKTGLAVAALYDRVVKERFGQNRVFVSLDEATEPRALVARLADELGLPAAGDEVSLLRSIEVYTSNQPAIAILDNAELVFEDQRAEAQRILRLVAQLPGLAIIMTIRGAAPHLAGGFVIDDLAKLSLPAAEAAFLAAAGPSFAQDPDLGGLIGALDGHVLSIQLIAAQAAGTPRLKPLLDAWEARHAAILVSGDGEETRASSLRASLAISIESPRVRSSQLVKWLLSILAYLPGGLKEADVPKLLGPPGQVSRLKAGEAVAVLHKLRLVEHRLDARLRMLNPLREATRLLVPIGASQRRRLLDKFMKIARQGEYIATDSWSRVKAAVELERDNLDNICLEAARRDITDSRVQQALWGYGEYARFVGGDIKSIEWAVEEAQRRGEWACASSLLLQLATIAFDRNDYEVAGLYYKRGDNVASSKGIKLISAQCIQGLGRVSMVDSNHDEAERRFRAALPKAQGAHLTEGNLLTRLCEIRLRQGAYEEAEQFLDKACSLHPPESLGMVNCLQYFAKLKPDEATVLLKRAIDLSEHVGSVASQAMSLNQLGSVEMGEREYEASIPLFSQALALARSIGSAAIEAEALLRRGCALRYLGDAAGRSEVEEGIDLYLKGASRTDRARAGWLSFRKTVLTREETETAALRKATADQWRQVERLDLIADFVNNLYPELPALS